MSGHIAKQSAWASLVNYSGSLVALFTTFYLFPLVYTKEQNGLIRMFIEIGALVAGLAQLGTGYSIWRFFPVFNSHEKRHNGAGFWILAIPFVGFLLVCLLLLIFQPLVVKYLAENSAQFLPYYYWLIPFVFFFTYNAVFEVLQSSLGNIIFSSFLRENVVRLLIGAIGLLFYLQYLPFDAAVKLTPAVYALVAVLNLWFLLKRSSLSFKPDFEFVNSQPNLKSDFSRYTGYLFLTYLANMIVQRLDFVMVSGIQGLGSTGVYSIALNLAILIEIPTRSILQISNPVLANAVHKGDQEEIERLYLKTTINQFIIGAMVLLLVWINIDVFYAFMPNGSEYASGKWVVLILGLGKLVMLLQGNSSAMLTFSNKYYYSLIINLISVVFGVWANNLLIPIYGINGAAFATAVTWLLAAIVIGILIWNIYRVNPYKKPVFISIFIFILAFLANQYISIPNHFIWSAAIKTLLLPSMVLYLILKFNLSDDIRSMLQKVGKRVGVRH